MRTGNRRARESGKISIAVLCARAVAVGYNMIDGMITATAVVATMP